MTELCYRVANHEETVDVQGEAARDAMVRLGYGLVSEVSCQSGTITTGADPEDVARGEREHEFAASLPEEELRQLRRQVGTVIIQEPGQLAPWGGKGS